MKEMQNGIKHLQMEQQSTEDVWMAIMVQSREHVLNLVQMGNGAQLLGLVMVFLLFFQIHFFKIFIQVKLKI